MDQQLALRLRYSVLFTAVLILVQLLAGCASSRHHTGQLTFTVLTVNMHTGDSTDARDAAHRIADVIRELDPDVVALQRMQRSALQSETFDVLTALSDLTGLTYAFGETRNDGEKRFGNGFLTRHPILEESNNLYPDGAPGNQNGLLSLVLEVGGMEMRVMNTHFGIEASEGDVSELRNLLRLAAPPRLLLASSDNLSGDEISRPLMDVLDDAWKRAGAGSGFTFPANDADRRSDFVFFDSGIPGFRVLAATILDTRTPMHLPLKVELEFVVN